MKEYVTYEHSQYEEYFNGIFKFGEHVKARYIKQENISFKNNILIEALPPERTSEMYYMDVYNPPIFNESERQKDAEYRINSVLRLLNCFFPVSYNLRIDSMLSRVIRNGYASKIVFSPEHIDDLKKYSGLLSNTYLKENDEIQCVYDNTASSGNGFSLFGISGAGKTTSVNMSLSYYPPVIIHTGDGENKFLFTQVVWIKIDCTYNGGMKGLCQKFFQELDRLLKGTNYAKQYGNSRNGVDTMITAMAHLVLKHAIGVLVIDEVQHILGNKKGEQLFNFFVTIMNDVKLPIIFLGTYKAYNTILAKDFRHGRRVTGISDIKWDRLNKDEHWKMFIEELWQYQWTKEYTPLTDRISDIMYENTAGITDRIIKLFIAVQIRAIESGQEKITIKLIQQVTKDSFNLTNDMIDALEQRDLNRLAKYEDLYSPDIGGFIHKKEEMKFSQVSKDIYCSESKNKKEREIQIRNNIVIQLQKMSYDIEDIVDAIDKVKKKFGKDVDEPILLKETCKMLIEKENPITESSKTVNKKTKRNKVSEEEKENFLLDNVKEDFI
ncbi:ATP-binding protein [Clostridium bornimense]|uniref:ATP-binding protein n=1 Tax=Clostridium bornimense TaxID=1216932 RepID=UPI001C11BC55|nr:ATP-binding protein [Clostridium bornimense]MBU5317733.1 ATP-binding protein [Clostridium bornimense]